MPHESPPAPAQRPEWRAYLKRALLVYGLIRLLLIPYGYVADQAAVIPQIDALPVRWFDYFSLPWNRFDTLYYLTLSMHGYGYDPATLGFHPLYSWLARPFGWLLGDWLVGLLASASVAGVAVLMLLQWLASFDLPPEAARRSILAFLALPSAYVIWAPYVESLFLCCALGCLIAARLSRWWLAGALGLLAALTRQQGVLLAVPILWEMSVAVGGWRALLRRWAWLPAAALPGAGLILLSLYRVLVIKDAPAEWWLPQYWVYGFLISPNAKLVVPTQEFMAPWRAMWLGFVYLSQRFDPATAYTWLDMVCGWLYLGLLAAVWRRLRPSYRAYSVLVYLLAFSHATGILPYIALPRHLLLAVPLVVPIAEWARTQRRQICLFAGAALLFLLQAGLHISNSWVP